MGQGNLLFMLNLYVQNSAHAGNATCLLRCDYEGVAISEWGDKGHLY